MRLSKLFHLNYIAAGYIALGALGGLLLLIFATCTYKEIGKCCRRKVRWKFALEFNRNILLNKAKICQSI